MDDNAELHDLIEKFTEYQAFFADRVPRLEAEAFKAAMNKGAKKKALEKPGELFVYSKLDAENQKLLDQSRLKEWQNYLKFKAVKVVSTRQSEELVSQGAEELPTQ